MNAVGKLLKGAESLSVEDLRDFSRSIQTLYVKRMDEQRNSVNVFDLSFPDFFKAHADIHGKPAFGKKFEQYLRHQFHWDIPTGNDPGDAVNAMGDVIEIKYSSIAYSKTKYKSICWNRITPKTKAKHYLLFAHDYRDGGTMYSFYLTKDQALKMRKNNKNNQITAYPTNRTNGNWVNLQPYLIGKKDSPIVPKHLTMHPKFARLAA